MTVAQTTIRLNVMARSCRRRKLVLSEMILIDGLFGVMGWLGGGGSDIHVHQLNEGSTDKTQTHEAGWKVYKQIDMYLEHIGLRTRCDLVAGVYT